MTLPAQQPQTYDPMACGARCDICPLGPNGALKDEDWKPVGPELHDGATVLAVAESPGPEEVEHGRPLVGRSGQEWNAALSACGKRRPDVDLSNVICCRPPGQASGAWGRMNKTLDRLNKKRSRQGQDPLPHPATCCRPRLLDEAKDYASIITLGKTATHALTGIGSSIQSTRGGPLKIDDSWSVVSDNSPESPPLSHRVRVLPTLHPAFICRSPGWRHVLHSDIGKAFRWFEDRLRWTNPEVLWRPTPDELADWLSQQAPFWAYDVETDGIEPLTCRLRTIAIAIPDLDGMGRAARESVEQGCRAVGISLLGADGGRRFYSFEDEERIKDILRRAFSDGRVWVGHNAGSYDRMVIEQHLAVTPRPLVDTLFSTRFRAPDLPKGLKTVGSILTDVDRWETTEKGTKISTGSHDDDELLKYNIVDTVVNARIVVPLVDAAAEAGAFRNLSTALTPTNWPDGVAWNLHEVDHATQDMCVNLHKNGIWIDQEARRAFEIEYEASVKDRIVRLKELAREAGLKSLDMQSVNHDDDPEMGDEFANPASADQIRRLMYDTWSLGIPPHMDTREFYTLGGLPGTGDVVLRGHLASGSLGPLQEAFIRELRLYRREHTKVLGTIIRPMQIQGTHEKGIVWPDGRVRSSWGAHITSVGRLSSAKPNVQNIASRRGLGRLKRIFAAPPGRILIGADLDQAHLRIIANYWKIPRLVDCLVNNLDPHNLLAHDMFGKDFETAEGWGEAGFSMGRKPSGGVAGSMRDIAKTLRYASIYGASPLTVWQVITSTESDGGNMPYLKMEPREVRLFHKKWLAAEPQWKDAWNTMVSAYEQQNFLEEPVLLRRSGNLSDGKLNEVVNFPVLAAESSIMRLAEHAVMEAFPFNFEGPGTGMIHQCHDSIAVEVNLPPGLDPLWAPTKGEALPPQLETMRRTLEECMCVSLPGWPITMTAEASVGRTLKDL